MRPHGIRRPATLATLGLLGLGALGMDAALAQKPPAPQPAPAPQAPPPRVVPGKPPAVATPQPSPAPQPPPRVATPTPAPAPGGKPPATQATPTPPRAPVVPQPIPANEPAGITALRQFLGDSQLSYTAAETIDPATGRARMTGVVITDPDGTRATADEVTVEQATREGARYILVRNLQGQTGTDRFTVAEMEMQNLVVRQPQGGQPSPDNVDIDRFTLRDARMTGRVEVVVGSALLEGWGQGRRTRVELSGFEIGGPPRDAPFDRLRVGRMALAGLDLPGIITAAMAGRSATPQSGEPFFEAEDLAATMRGQPVASIASFGARSRMDATGSGTGTLALRGLVVQPVAALGDWLRRYGYAELRAEMTADSSYDASTGRLDLSSFRLAGQDIGTLTLSFLIEGMTQDATMRQDFSGVRLFGARIGWLDQSILQRAVRDMARGMNMSEQALREQWATLAGAMLTQRGAQAMDGLRDAVQRYIRGQATEIEIRAEPPQPVPVMQLQGINSPVRAQQMLGLTATAR